MGLTIKPSDLYHRYRKDAARRHEPKFSGKPDPTPFNRDDIYDVIPMFEQVMEALGRDDQRTLHAIEEVLIKMPGFVTARDEVFDFLVGTMQDILEG